uniref:Uncharacterized protein n=1 Tax=Arundo donax TaxID=35708 RepID=A0A0A9F755_ARUDO
MRIKTYAMDNYYGLNAQLIRRNHHLTVFASRRRSACPMRMQPSSRNRRGRRRNSAQSAAGRGSSDKGLGSS